jgi:hypothetical protein
MFGHNLDTDPLREVTGLKWHDEYAWWWSSTSDTVCYLRLVWKHTESVLTSLQENQ